VTLKLSRLLSLTLACKPGHLLIMHGSQLVAFAISSVLAFLLRFDFRIPETQVTNLAYAVATGAMVRPIVFHIFGLAERGWRFVSIPDLRRLAYANITGSAVILLTINQLPAAGFPKSIYVLDCALCFLLTSGMRIAARITVETAVGKAKAAGNRTFIYGAGAAGVMLAREIRLNPSMGHCVVGFVDDDPAKIGLMIHGIPVLNGGEALNKLAKTYNIHQVLIAIPSATGRQMAKILEYCAAARLKFRTVPGLSEIMQGQRLSPQLRDVAVEDLLGRIPVRLEETSVRERLQDKVVAVTGAAGSIGSELCRQIARSQPRCIIGFEAAETPLFHLERELRQSFSDVSFVPVIGDVRNSDRVLQVFSNYRPSVVYHAAAYKHVPMMEAHLFEAVENNVIGTWNVASAAHLCDVEHFVMISTDKAVRPTSIMGLTKRVSELLVSSLDNRNTKFVSVRFGNVLGSNGSVVPLFKQQIAAGGPVTVTHPDMRRYFMTIPEAAQLVLQVSAFGKGGEVFVLDMGEPIKIVDLARNLILLSGLRPDEDIRIEFTGVRSGEKLFEELHTTDEITVPTPHERIRIFAGTEPHIKDVRVWVEEIRRMCRGRDKQLLIRFKELVPEYSPSLYVMREFLEYEARPIDAHVVSITETSSELAA
jgi:FlaA1/EpsC-like NDP-sugar epimerase